MNIDNFFLQLYCDMGVDFFYLHRTQPISQHTSDVQGILERMYLLDKGELYPRLATIFNSVFTQNTQTFLFSRRTMVKLMKEDENFQHSGLSGNDYKLLLAKMTNSSMFETLRPPTNNHAGVYKVIHPDIVNELARQIGKKALEAQEKSIINYYDSKILELKNQKEEQEDDDYSSSQERIEKATKLMKTKLKKRVEDV